MIEVGSSLSTLTSLRVFLQNTSGSAIAVSLLFEALAKLVGGCPCLKHMHSQGKMTVAFMRELGHVCPCISHLSITANDDEIPHLEQLLLLQPSFFPLVKSISFPGLHTALPDMSANDSILSVQLKDFRLTSNAGLANMPPKLQHLSLDLLLHDPKALVGVRNICCSLHSLELVSSPDVFLHEFTEFLRAAPALKVIKTLSSDVPFMSINCCMETAADVASDLLVVRGYVGIDIIKNAHFFFNLDEWKESVGCMQSVIASLPRMTGFTNVEIECNEDELRPFLNVFPDVQKLGLQCCYKLDDAGLQVLTTCQQMTHLYLSFCCVKLTSCGVNTLCLHLPRLFNIICSDCHGSTEAACESCNKMLERQGLLARLFWED